MDPEEGSTFSGEGLTIRRKSPIVINKVRKKKYGLQRRRKSLSKGHRLKRKKQREREKNNENADPNVSYDIGDATNLQLTNTNIENALFEKNDDKENEEYLVLQENSDVENEENSLFEENNDEENEEYLVLQENSDMENEENSMLEENNYEKYKSVEEEEEEKALAEETQIENYQLVCDTDMDAGRLKQSNIEGRRIVDLNFFLQDMHTKFDNHSPGLACGFGDIIAINNYKHGLITKVEMQCQMCLYRATISSEAEDGEKIDINRSAAIGTISTGIGYSQLNELLATMDIPCMSEKTYQKYHDEVSDIFEYVANEEMKIAAEEEKRLAIERGDIIDNIPHIPVVADGSWMKRSYRTGKYDSLSGVGAIVGYYTGKILFIGVRNKFCAVCERAARKKVEVSDHICFKNWERNRSSTSMESDAIVEGFKNSIAMHGLIYSTLIADGDSSVYKRIIDSNPYFNVHVRKIECTNHLLRNLGHRIKEISKIKGRVGPYRKKIQDSTMRIRNSIVKAAEYRNKEECPTTQKVRKLKEDMFNVASHVFGEHKYCARLAYFCDGSAKEGEENIVPKLKEFGIFQKIEEAIHQLSRNAESLLYNVNSNCVEGYNSIVCKFIGGKRINFGKRRSYATRCSGAALQYNTQCSLTSISNALGKEAPICNKLEQQRIRRTQSTAESKKEMKKRYLDHMATNNDTNPRKRFRTDEDYGPNSQKPDMEQQDYEVHMNLHMQRLKEWQEERDSIERSTVNQDKSETWLMYRKKLLTASNFGRVCRMRSTTSCANLVKTLLYGQPLKNAAVEYGKKYEDDARKQIEDLQIKIQQCGLFIDGEIPYLAATPDGLIDGDGIVEIKCPYGAKEYTPQEAIRHKISGLNRIFKEDTTELNTAHHYYYQIQGQLHITERTYCLFCIWTPKGILTTIVCKDDTFWKQRMEPMLSKFYINCLLPEIVDSRHDRNMSIRDPSYIIEAQNKRK